MEHRVAINGDAEGAAIGQDLRVGTSVAHPAKRASDQAEPTPGVPKVSANSASTAAGETASAQTTGLSTGRQAGSKTTLMDLDGRPSRRATHVAVSVAQWARTYPKTIDAVLGLGLFVLAIYSSHLTQIELIDGQELIDKIRPSAEAAIKLGGEVAIGGQETLRVLNEQPPQVAAIWLYLLGAVSTLPLMVRRLFPDIVHPIIFGGFLLTLWVFPLDIQIASLSAWLSTYTFATYGRISERLRNAFLLITGTGLVLFLTGVVRNRAFFREPLHFRQVFFYALLTVVLYGSPIVFGLVMRRHLATLDQLRSRTETLQIQQLTLQQQQADLERTAILNERVRIARELHDVVAHHVSVMGMQAGAARLTLGSNDTPVGKALGTIEQSSREAVTNLHQLLGFLRAGQRIDNRDIASPQPSLESLPLLIDEHRNAGYAVEASLGQDLERVQPSVALSGYRIVQEALTNIRKHANSQHETIVNVLVDQDRLKMTIKNGAARETTGDIQPEIPPNNSSQLASTYLTGRKEPSGPGLGLRGMYERVELHNGSFKAAPTGDGGFEVAAVLPGAVTQRFIQTAEPLTTELSE
jgi:signal transduction histidine kinase